MPGQFKELYQQNYNRQKGLGVSGWSENGPDEIIHFRCNHANYNLYRWKTARQF